MKCFVAMAFAHEDTNRFFDHAICSALNERGIEVVRVDKLIHNDNIDDRIMQEIVEADFMIADLTYTRPSVYYEAGFAERVIPVIYTVRRDHFSADPNDPHGNLRVHFDLSMRNIIDWIEPEDPIFLQRLRQRIDLITGPLLDARKATQEVVKEAAEFQCRPVADREDRIYVTTDKWLTQRGYIGSRWLMPDGSISNSARFKRSANWFLPSRSDYRYVEFRMIDSPGQVFFKTPPDYNLNVGGFVGEWHRIEEHYLYGSFAKISLNDIGARLGLFSRSQGTQTYVYVSSLDVPALEKGHKGPVSFSGQSITWDFFGLASGDYRRGFCTAKAPIHSQYLDDAYDRGLKFVYAGYSTREIKRSVFAHIIDEIISVTDFEKRLAAAFEQVATCA